MTLRKAQCCSDPPRVIHSASRPDRVRSVRVADTRRSSSDEPPAGIEEQQAAAGGPGVEHICACPDRTTGGLCAGTTNRDMHTELCMVVTIPSTTRFNISNPRS
ncbi:hypothetical protein BBK36DRAFT_1175223, partial [Trichoderma citrinoviride]